MSIARVAQLAADGFPVVFPTETVYGVGARFDDPAAIRRVFELKQRPPSRPLIVHVADPSALSELASEVPDWAWTLAERVWPGPLTLVVRKAVGVPLEVTGGGETVGVRAPDQPQFSALIEQLVARGGPPGLAGTSANRHGETPATQLRDVSVPVLPDAMLDGGPCVVGIESTVVDATRASPTILRVGALAQPRIAEIIGHEITLAPGVDALARPQACRWALTTRERLMSLAWEPSIAVVASFAAPNAAWGPRWVSLPADIAEIGRSIYQVLAQLEADGARTIHVEAFDEAGLGAAINERIRRRGR